MKTELIEKALNILKGHDWYYMMVDYGYERARAKAKASRDYFVEVTNEIGGEARELLRALWIATYNHCACFRPCWTSDSEPECKKALEEAQANLNVFLAA